MNSVKSSGSWCVIKDEDGFLICDTSGAIGRIVAHTQDLDDAILLAASPLLLETVHETRFAYETSFAEYEEDEDIGLSLLGKVDAVPFQSSNLDTKEGK